MVFIKKQGHVLEIHLVQQREQRIRVTVKDMRLSIPLSPKKVKGRKRRQKKEIKNYKQWVEYNLQNI